MVAAAEVVAEASNPLTVQNCHKIVDASHPVGVNIRLKNPSSSRDTAQLEFFGPISVTFVFDIPRNGIVPRCELHGMG